MNRLKYICSTTVRMISLVAAVCILSFILVSASPVDPLTSYVGAESTLSEEAKEQIAEHWGLEDPPVERFVKWADPWRSWKFHYVQYACGNCDT